MLTTTTLYFILHSSHKGRTIANFININWWDRLIKLLKILKWLGMFHYCTDKVLTLFESILLTNLRKEIWGRVELKWGHRAVEWVGTQWSANPAAPGYRTLWPWRLFWKHIPYCLQHKWVVNGSVSLGDYEIKRKLKDNCQEIKRCQLRRKVKWQN